MTDLKKEIKTRPGIPMSEEELQEWKKTFIDIDENIKALYEQKDEETEK